MYLTCYTILSLGAWLLSHHFTKCDVYYITPSTSSSCPTQSCFTLNEFAANVQSLTITTSVVFLPGNHSLTSHLTIRNETNFLMISNTNNLWIICNEHANFRFISTSFVQIKNLAFLGCGENEAENLTNLVIEDSIFHGIQESGTAFLISRTNAKITKSQFVHNRNGAINFQGVRAGGALFIHHSNVWISQNVFTRNDAKLGGAIFVKSKSNVTIRNTVFTNNEAESILAVIGYSNISLHISNFSCSSTNHSTGVIQIVKSIIEMKQCIFRYLRGTIIDAFQSNITEIHSVYIDNKLILAKLGFDNKKIDLYRFKKQPNTEVGLYYYFAMIRLVESTITIAHSTYNHSVTIGVLFFAVRCTIFLSNSRFYDNYADYSLLHMQDDILTLNSTMITHNNASNKAVIFFDESTVKGHQKLDISHNKGRVSVVHLVRSTANFTDGILFSNNLGSLLVINSIVTFSGINIFEKCILVNFNNYTWELEEGGAITALQSDIILQGTTSFIENYSQYVGGAIHATGSKLHMYGEVVIDNNTAGVSGGGMYLYQSQVDCYNDCTISHNTATEKGGGIHAIASVIIIKDEVQEDARRSYLSFTENNAKLGGALNLEMNSKLYGLEAFFFQFRVIFDSNTAEYGGAVYVSDGTNSGSCINSSVTIHSTQTECFLQRLYNDEDGPAGWRRPFQFFQNAATSAGSAIYGGLLDRCTIHPLAITVSERNDHNLLFDAISYFKRLTNIQDLIDVRSDPVRVCHCVSMHPNCSYKYVFLPVYVMKGVTFNLTLAAVDQVNHTVHATIHSSLSSLEGGFGEGQQSQNISDTCSSLMFNVYSPHDSEELLLYAEGPCKNTGISQIRVQIQFANCTCPIGFWPSEKEVTKCECVCDPKIQDYIKNCSSTTESLQREGNFWINYIHTTINNSLDQEGYLVYPNCPYDYCLPASPSVSINLNVYKGADVQCAFNRSGLLCGRCKSGFSLSLGSSSCIKCPKTWLAHLIGILIGALIAGIVLVAIIFTLNMTVAIGTLNGIIFYANIVAANKNIFLPSSNHEYFFTVFISWLNLEIGIDTCFVKGMDAYDKAWF